LKSYGQMSLPWYRQVTHAQWKAFLAAFLGWVLDGFDFMILTFVIIDIQRSFAIDSALAGALGTVTMLTRLVGGIGAGTAADKWGRKGPLILSIFWFTLFAFLSGFSTSYAMLFMMRALFGIGMGGEWAAGMPLALEHWPSHLRGIASGLLQGGFSWGVVLASLVFRYLYPLFNATNLGWRVMFWVAVVPGAIVLWMAKDVQESPVWLDRRRGIGGGHRKTDPVSLARLFNRDLMGVTLQTCVLMGAFMWSYHSTSFWYVTFLREKNFNPFWYSIALNIGGIAGALVWGRAAETRLGRRGAVTCGALIGIVTIPLFLMTTAPVLVLFGALLMGLGGPGMWGVIPTYLSERFPTAARGAGSGLAYHAGAAIGSATPTLIGALKDRGTPLNVAMAAFIAASNFISILLIWAGPETKGRSLETHEL